MKLIVLLLTFTAGRAAFGLNISFQKALSAEFTRCQSVLPIQDIHSFALQSDLGFLSEDEIKAKVGEKTLHEFTRLVGVVKPYLEALDERGEVMDLTGKDELTVSCAKFAKGVFIMPYHRLLVEGLRNKLSHDEGSKK